MSINTPQDIDTKSSLENILGRVAHLRKSVSQAVSEISHLYNENAANLIIIASMLIAEGGFLTILGIALLQSCSSSQ